MPLTDTAIRNAKPAGKALRLFDSGGLYLEVAPAGGKWWRFKYRFRARRGVSPSASTLPSPSRRPESDARQPGSRSRQG